MEKDTTSNDVRLLGVTSIALPDTVLRQITEPSAIATLEYEILLEISRVSSRNVVYRLLNDLKDRTPASLAETLSKPEVLAESTFMSVASQLFLFRQNNGVTKLVDAGVKFENGEKDTNAYLLRALRTEQAKLAEAIREVADEKTGDTARNWFPYKIATRDVLQKLTRVSEAQLAATLEEHFISRGFGKFTSIMPFAFDGGWGRFVKHGVHRNTREVLNLEELPNYARDRYTKTDLLLAVADASTLFIGTQFGREAVAYVKALGQAIGEPSAFLMKQTADMSAFLDKNIGNRLLKVAPAIGITKIQITEAWIRHGVKNGTRLVAEKNGCVTDQPDFHYYAQPQNSMLRLNLRFCADHAGKDFVDFEVKPGGISMQSNSNPVLIASALSRLEVWTPFNDG